MYEDDIRRLISLYKFHGRRELSKFFCEVLFIHYMAHFRGRTVVPAPALPSSRKKRGWDQVGVIMKLLHREHRVPYLDCLKREVGSSQKTLDYEGRMRNLQGKIRMRKVKTVPESVVILDDVFTTGATVHECATVIHRLGVTDIAAMTLALDY